MVFILSNTLKLCGFPMFWHRAYLMNVILSVPDECCSERTWWWLFWAYLMNVILSVPDECCSERTWWMLFWTYLMNVILNVPDECYSERTWWRLFQKPVVRTKFDIYVFIEKLNFDYSKVMLIGKYECTNILNSYRTISCQHYLMWC